MARSQASLLLLVALSALFVWATYLVIEPFVWPIFTAGILAIAFYPLYCRFEGRMRRPWVAALTTVLLIVAVVLAPITAIAVRLTADLQRLIVIVNERSQESGGFLLMVQSWVDEAARFAAPVLHLPAADVRARILTGLERARSFALAKAGGLVGDVFGFLLQAVLVLALLYLFLLWGRAIVNRGRRLLLLEEQDTAHLLESITNTVQASMYGMLSVAAAQAILMGLGLAFFGVPGAVLWGVVTMFASLIPLVGSALVWIPAAVYLFTTAGAVKGIAMAVWGGLIVGSADNVLRPIAMQGKVSMHPMLLLFALIGGTQLFGLLGLFAGPIIFSLCFALLAILERELEKRGWLS